MGSLTVLDHDPEEEGLVQMEDEEQPDEADAILLHEGLDFPVNITEGILEESSNVLECTPFLCHITGLSSCINKLVEVTVSFFSKSSI